MTPKKQKTPHVVVTFNGKKQTLEEWTRSETAAEKEKSLNWQTAFPKQEQKLNNGQLNEPSQSNRTGKLLQLKKNHRRKRTWSARKSIFKELTKSIRFFWLPAAAAIVVGLVTGLTMLMIFAGEQQKGTEQWTNGLGNGASVSQATSSLKRENLNLSVFAVQAGVFSTKKSADQQADTLRRQGTAAITVEREGQASVYIAATESETRAKQLAEYYRSQGTPAYHKAWQIRSSDQPAILTEKGIDSYILQGKNILGQLVGASGEGTNQPFSSSKQMIDKISESMEKWEKPSSNAVTQDLLVLVNQYRDQLSKAVTLLRELQESGAEQEFAAYQQALLNTLAAYHQLIAAEHQ